MQGVCKLFSPLLRYISTSILSVPGNCKFFMAALHPKCEQDMTPLLWKLHDEGASHAANAENEDGNAIMHGTDLMNAKNAVNDHEDRKWPKRIGYDIGFVKNREQKHLKTVKHDERMEEKLRKIE